MNTINTTTIDIKKKNADINSQTHQNTSKNETRKSLYFIIKAQPAQPNY